MLKKAKMTKKAAEECEKLRQQAKRKGDSRGVDPSSEKKQKTEKGKEEKKKEKEVYFDSSDSDDEGLMIKALPIDVIWKKRVIRSKIVREGWMSDNGLNNVIELIKRQRWENLFKKRLLVHVDAVKEFYAKMTVIHLKKKDIVKSKVRGVEIEFDHEKLATILGIPGKNGICEYIKEVWEESKYTKPLEITRRFANDATIMKARRVQSIEMKPSQRFIHFLVMKNVIPRFGKRDTSSFLDLTYMDHLMARRGRGEGDDEGNKDDFDREAIIDEATVEGESESDDQFYDAQVGEEEPVTETPAAPAVPASSSAQQKDQEPAGVDPSGLTGRDADFLKFQAEFERKRANKFHDELEKAKAENAKLLALLHQAQTKPHP
ncbi:hypothetical protein Dimus_037769 [Dionaea muscipula]